MKRPRGWVLVLGILGLVAAAFLLQGIIRWLVVDTFSDTFWSLSILYRSFAQYIYWVIGMAILFMIAINSLITRRARDDEQPLEQRLDTGPLEKLSWWFSQINRGPYFRWRLARRLGELALAILSEEKEPDPLQAAGILQSMDSEMPDEIRNYLLAGLNPYDRPAGNRGRRIWTGRHAYDLDAERVLEYLETKMELRSGR